MQGLLENIHVYRIWRQRRLILVSALLPALGLIALWAAGGPEGPLQGAFLPQGLALFWVLTALWHALRFPRAPVNLLTGGLATAGLVLAVPLGDWLLAQVKGPAQPPHVFGLIVLGAGLWLALLVLSETLLERGLLKGRPRTCRLRRAWRSPLAPDAYMQAWRPRPDTATALYRSGPAKADGRFAVWEAICGPLPEATGPWQKPALRAPDYWVLSVEDPAPGQCSTLYATSDGKTEAILTTVTAEGAGARVVQHSVSDVLTLAALVLRYLTDLGTDIAVAEGDLLKGRPIPRANCLQPIDFPLRGRIAAMKEKEASTPPYF